jgi:geranylgeranyl pyrophosphate synthase
MDTKESNPLLVMTQKLIKDYITGDSKEISSPWLNTPLEDHFVVDGKFIRPRLVFATLDLLKVDPEQGLYLAAAIEMFHNFTLIHDDLVDLDRKRRDNETLWFKHGKDNAINCGDFLHQRANDLLVDGYAKKPYFVDLYNKVSVALGETAHGQATDMNIGLEDLTLSSYEHFAKQKTGYLLAASMSGAAIIAGRADIAKEFFELGILSGLAYQIADDLIDLTAGKGRDQVGLDIMHGQPTILSTYALCETRGNDREKLLSILKKPKKDTQVSEVQWVINLYETCGAISHAQERAREVSDVAINKLESLVSKAPENKLSPLIDSFVTRKK